MTPALWERVEAELEALPRPPYPQTGTLCSRLVVVKEKKGVRSARMFLGSDQTAAFSRRIRLKKGMFGDHMPFSYKAIFEKLGQGAATVPLSALDRGLEGESGAG